MEKYRVLLVDDEAEIRQGISQKMEWEALGFTLVGQGENGREALELAEQLRPDVVLTDIQMPFLDGLELCRLLSARSPATKFVIFSGFDQFTYAKQAISLNVFEYILKPINAQELSQVLLRLREDLDQERRTQQDIALLEQHYQEHLPLLRELFLSRLLEGRIPSEEIPSSLENLSLSLQGERYLVALLELQGGNRDRSLNAMALQQMLETYFRWDPDCYCQFFYGDAMAMIVGLGQEDSPYPFITEINGICDLCSSYLNASLTVGVGLPCQGLDLLSQSHQGAKNALDYRVLLQGGKALFIGDIVPSQEKTLVFSQNQEQELTRCIKLGQPEELRAIVEKMVEALYASGMSLWQSQLYFMELITAVLKLIRSFGLESQDIFGQNFAGKALTEFAHQEELTAWLMDHCLRIQENIRKQHSDTTWHTVEKAKEFIQTHYAQPDLSVETLCQYLHLSPTYFSALFKGETGVTFTTFVTQIRMEQGAHLLRTTQDKTYVIGEQVGYLDSNYFSYVFKKHFGVSPTKYRSGD